MLFAFLALAFSVALAVVFFLLLARRVGFGRLVTVHFLGLPRRHAFGRRGRAARKRDWEAVWITGAALRALTVYAARKTRSNAAGLSAA